jgi:hypothetical protein
MSAMMYLPDRAKEGPRTITMSVFVLLDMGGGRDSKTVLYTLWARAWCGVKGRK